MSRTLYFGPDVPLRHIMQIMLDEHGVVAANRRTGKTTALLEYVAFHSFRLKTHMGILCLNETSKEQAENMFRNKYGSFKFAPFFHCEPTFFRGRTEQIYVDEPWGFDMDRLRRFEEIPIFGAIGTPEDFVFEQCPPLGPGRDSIDPDTGFDFGPFALHRRFSI